MAKAYGVVHGVRPFPERWTYIIGKDGRIAHIDKKVKAGDHANAVLEKLDELKIEKVARK